MFLLNLELSLVNCRQLRNLEKAFDGDVRVCDRTALILDIFSQRAATREATLQVLRALYARAVLCTSLSFGTF